MHTLQKLRAFLGTKCDCECRIAEWLGAQARETQAANGAIVIPPLSRRARSADSIEAASGLSPRMQKGLRGDAELGTIVRGYGFSFHEHHCSLYRARHVVNDGTAARYVGRVTRRACRTCRRMLRWRRQFPRAQRRAPSRWRRDREG